MAEEPNAEIEVLTTYKVEAKTAPLKAVFGSAISLLTLVRNETTEDELLAESIKLCVKTCHVFAAMTRESGMNTPSRASKQWVDDLGRIVCSVEFAAKERASCARDLQGHDRSCTEESLIEWRTELCQILTTIEGGTRRGSVVEPTVGAECEPSPATAAFSGEPHPLTLPQSSIPIPNTDLTPQASPLVPTNLGGLLPLTLVTNPIPKPPSISDSDRQALRCLVSGAFPPDKLGFLIETLLSNVKVVDLVKSLPEGDAQAFIDRMAEALEVLKFPPRIHRKCVESSYKLCARHKLLPRSLHFELSENPVGDVRYRGGFADVFKGKWGDREIAVKVLRPRDFTSQEMVKRFCKEAISWNSLRHRNVLPLLGVQMAAGRLAMISEWMKNGNVMQFTTNSQDANRFELLADVAKGLAYVHSREMVHGDLKGANILVDSTGRARLADFGLLTIASDTTPTSQNSFLEGGTYRWMSPELFDPKKFNLKDGRPTKNSDRYALGMVIYEVLSGQVPFYEDRHYAVIAKVLRGECPTRPRGWEGSWFVDDIWNILGRCWESTPRRRPAAEDVLCCLERVSNSWAQPPTRTGVRPPTTGLASDSISEHSSDEGQATSGTISVIRSSICPVPSPIKHTQGSSLSRRVIHCT